MDLSGVKKLFTSKIKDRVFDLIFYFRAGKACKTSVAKLCLHNFITECSRGRRRRQKGLIRRQSPLRGWLLTLTGLSLRDNSKITRPHFVHLVILSNPLLGFSTLFTI